MRVVSKTEWICPWKVVNHVGDKEKIEIANNSDTLPLDKEMLWMKEGERECQKSETDTIKLLLENLNE